MANHNPFPEAGNSYAERRPHPDEPGTLRQQLAAIAFYLTIPREQRQADRATCWQAARWKTIPHARRIAA